MTFERGGRIQALMFYARYILPLLLLAAHVVAAPAKIDAAADQLLRKVTAEFQAAKTAEVDLRLAVKVRVPAQDLKADYALSIARPNKFALIRKTGDLGASAISDGTNAVTFLAQPNVYAVQPAPKDITGIEAESNSPSGDSMGSMAFIAALFSPQPYDALLVGVTEATFAGVESGLKRVNFKQQGMTWSLFLTNDARPTIHRIEVNIPQMLMTLEFSHWRFNAEIGAERFKFVPPAGAKKVPSVYEKEEEGEDSDLVGEEWPEIKLKTADGGAFDSSSLNGKVALVVCWAGDADHSIQALRAGSDLAAKKKIAFAAINVEPDAESSKILATLAKHQLAIKSALDPMSVAMEKLEVEGVPLTFLIDKSGTVRKAWLGFHLMFRDIVGKEIDRVQGVPAR